MISVKIPLNSPIFSIFLRNSPIFSENDRKNDRKRPKTTGNDRENGSTGKSLRNEMERNGIKRNDFPRIFREKSTKFHEILRISLFFHGYSIKFHRYSIKFRIFASV